MEYSIRFPAVVMFNGAAAHNGQRLHRLTVKDSAGEWFCIYEPHEDRHMTAQVGHVLHEVCDDATVELTPPEFRW